MASDTIRLTPTEERMANLLSDGREHTREELRACLRDEMSMSIKQHLYTLRKKLRTDGFDIRCELRGETSYYRRVSIYSPPESVFSEGGWTPTS